MKVEFTVPYNPDDWLRIMGQQFNVPVTDNYISLPEEVGEGYFKHFELFEGIILKYLKIKGKIPLEIVRNGVSDSPLMIAIFYSQEQITEQYVEGKPINVGYHTSNGVFMPSSEITCNWQVPQDIDISLVAVVFNKEMILKNLLNTDSYLYKLFESDKSFYVFETLTQAMHHSIEEIHEIISKNGNLKNLSLQQRTIELLNLFLQEVDKRSIPNNTVILQPVDIKKLFEIRKFLIDNIHQVPSVPELAANAGMSVSKFQKCFRQVFGQNVSQYVLAEKMNMARQLFESKNYSVSEVGYMLGYSNLSHFTKAFKNHFLVTPKSYLRNL